jgi:RNA polymerase sigma-70 factor (ECF subfamily)
MIERLPEPYREALALVELRGLSQVEAAARLGLSVSGAKSRVQRGRRMLRDLVVACCDVSLGARSDVTDFTLRRGASCGGCGPTAT